MRHFIDLCSIRTLHDFCCRFQFESFGQGSKVRLTIYNSIHLIKQSKKECNSLFHATKYKNEMKFHMLMFMNAWMMLVRMKCRCQMQCLTPWCYTLVYLLSEKATAASIRRVEECRTHSTTCEAKEKKSEKSVLILWHSTGYP